MEKLKEWFKNGRDAGKNIAKMFSIIWRLDKSCMFLLFIETVFFAISVFPEMFLLKASADALTSGKPFEEYVVIVIIWIGISLLRNLGWNYINTISPARQSRMIQKMQNEYSKKCLELDYDMLAKPAILDVKNVAQQAIYGGMGDSTWEFLTMISNAIVLFASLGIVLTVDAWSVLLTAVLIFTSPFMHAGLWKKQYNIAVEKETTARQHEYFHNTFSDFANLKDVRIYNMAEKIARKIGSLITELIQSEKKVQNVSFAVTSTTVVVSVLLNAGIYTLLGVKLLSDTITIGEFLLAFSALSVFKDKLSGIAGWFSSYIRASHFIEKYFEFLALDGDFSKGDVKITDLDLSRNPTVRFENVSFKYPGQDIYALKNVNAEITLGAKVSVVGENGAGKTTFVKLLCRLYDPTEGRILLGGTDIRNLKYDDLMSLFSCVFQDFKLFSFTIGQNIDSRESELGKDTSGRVAEAAGKAEIVSRIELLSKKYDTTLFRFFDDDGVELSGGEMQKLAIARSAYKRSRVIIMDEPAAMLDPRAEYELFSLLNNTCGDETAIFISHRLSSTKFSDKILVFDSGKLIEEGTHESLIMQNGKYAELYNIQSQLYTEDSAK